MNETTVGKCKSSQHASSIGSLHIHRRLLRGKGPVRAWVRACVRVSGRACEFVYVNEDGLQDQ